MSKLCSFFLHRYFLTAQYSHFLDKYEFCWAQPQPYYPSYLFQTNRIETPPGIHAVSRATLALSRVPTELIKYEDALTEE
jgi:hypothetical protein